MWGKRCWKAHEKVAKKSLAQANFLPKNKKKKKKKTALTIYKYTARNNKVCDSSSTS